METRTMYVINSSSLQSGEILEVEGSYDGKYFYYYAGIDISVPHQAIPGEFFDSVEDAVKVLEERRQAEVALYRQTLDKLKKIKFSVKTIRTKDD